MPGFKQEKWDIMVYWDIRIYIYNGIKNKIKSWYHSIKRYINNGIYVPPIFWYLKVVGCI